MRKLKKALSLFLALAMMLSLCTTGFAAKGDTVDTYDDYTATDTEAEIAVDILTQLGYVEGYEDGEFKADYNFTREQAAKIITYIMAGYDAGYAIYNTEVETGFADVDSTRWSSGVVAYAASQDVIAGYGNGYYGPEDTLTEAQWIKMLLVAVLEEDSEQFLGDGWETAAIDKAINLGLLTTDEYTANSSSLTREWACVLAVRAMLLSTAYDGTRGSLYSTVYGDYYDGNDNYVAPYVEYTTVGGETATETAEVIAVYENDEITADGAIDSIKKTYGYTVTYDNSGLGGLVEIYGLNWLTVEDGKVVIDTTYAGTTEYETYDPNDLTGLAAIEAEIDTVEAISGDYPDYRYLVINGETYLFSENYNYDGSSAEVQIGGEYVVYLDSYGNILYITDYKYDLISDQGLAYVVSAAVYTSYEAVKGESAYDYTYNYELQISLEVIYVENGVTESTIVDLALVEYNGAFYAVDECGLTDFDGELVYYTSLIEDIVAELNDEVDSPVIDVCGVEFPLVGGSFTVDLRKFYTYYTYGDTIVLSEDVTDKDITIDGSDNLINVSYTDLTTGAVYTDVDAASTASYSEILVTYNNGTVYSLEVVTDIDLTEEEVGYYNQGVVTMNNSGYVTDVVTITTKVLEGESFYAIYMGNQELNYNGVLQIFGTSYDSDPQYYYLDESYAGDDLVAGVVYLVTTNYDGDIISAVTQEVAASGYVYNIDETYLSLGRIAGVGNAYESYVTAVSYGGVAYTNGADYRVSTASYAVGDYVNLYLVDGDIYFITVGHTYDGSDTVEAIEAEDGTLTVTDPISGNTYTETSSGDALVDGGIYKLSYYNDTADINDIVNGLYDISYVETQDVTYVVDGYVENGELVGTVTKYYGDDDNCIGHAYTDYTIAYTYELTEYGYPIIVAVIKDADGNAIDTVEAVQENGYLVVNSSGKITGVTTANGDVIALSDDYYNQTVEGATTVNGLTVKYVTVYEDSNNVAIYSVAYNPGTGTVTVLMNIPYEQFYYELGVENVDGVDAVTAATTSKGAYYNFTGSAYYGADDDDGVDGVTYYVTMTVEDYEAFVALGYEKVTDDDTATVVFSRSVQEYEITGSDVLTTKGDYAYYLIVDSSDVTSYLTATIEDGAVVITGSTFAEATEVYVIGEVTTDTSYGDYELDLDISDYIENAYDVAAVTLNTTDGCSYALLHVEEVWTVGKLAWSGAGTTAVHGSTLAYELYEGIQGKYVESVTYYLSDGSVYTFTLTTPSYITPYVDDVTTDQDTYSQSIIISGIPDDAENVSFTLSASGTEYSVTWVKNEDGTYTLTADETLEVGTTYTVTISADNYVLNSVDVTITLYQATEYSVVGYLQTSGGVLQNGVITVTGLEDITEAVVTYTNDDEVISLTTSVSYDDDGNLIITVVDDEGFGLLPSVEYTVTLYSDNEYATFTLSYTLTKYNSSTSNKWLYIRTFVDGTRITSYVSSAVNTFKYSSTSDDGSVILSNGTTELTVSTRVMEISGITADEISSAKLIQVIYNYDGALMFINLYL